jgi:hypothetical protein
MSMDLTLLSNSSSLNLNSLSEKQQEINERLESLKASKRPVLNDYLDEDKQKKKKEAAGDSFTLTDNASATRESNYSQLDAIEKYRHMLTQSQKLNVVNAINQPEKTIKEMDKIIERTLRQGVSPEDQANLQKALQTKQIAQKRLDMLA